MKEIIVIGGGPAGLMAAGMAAQQGARVNLLEKKERVGSKLRITGKGRCNITADVDMESLIKGIPGNGRFLYGPFHEFSNYDLIKFFNERGLQTRVERGNRVFPQSDRAQDVVDLLDDYARKSGVSIHTAANVQGIQLEQGKLSGVKTSDGYWLADAVIIATGGLSYPGTGSTGDGYGWARSLGHSLIDPRPGLVPLIAAESWIKDLQGLSLKNVAADAYTAKGKKINGDFGELLFTHFGLSGPIILSMSRDIGEYMYRERQAVKIKLDLKPALSEDKLDERLLRDFDKYSRKLFKNSLNDLLPQKLISVFINLSGIDPEKFCTRSIVQSVLN